MKTNTVWSVALSLSLLLCSSPVTLAADNGVTEFPPAGDGKTDGLANTSSAGSSETQDLPPTEPPAATGDVTPAATTSPRPSTTKAPPTAKKEAEKKPAAGNHKLFGRIEQIAGETNVEMPVLKAQKAKLDPREKRAIVVAGRADETKYSGSVATTFPTDFQGNWGGEMQVWSYSYSPLYASIDRAEAMKTAQLLQRGRKGKTNYVFYNGRDGKIALQPNKVMLSVPLKDTNSFAQLAGGGMGGMMSMMGNMEAPAIMIYFGDYATSGMETGVSGNQTRQTVRRNVIRQLSPDVLEQQIITQHATRVSGTGKLNTGYDESVIRFTKMSSNSFSVLSAVVKYNETGKYLSKLIMNGAVTKGVRVQTDPMGGMNSMMQQMMGGKGALGGMGGLGGLGGGGAAGAGNMNNLNQLLKQQQGGGGSGGAGINDMLKQLKNLGY